MVKEIRYENLVVPEDKQDSLIDHINRISDFNTQSMSLKETAIRIEIDTPSKTWKLRFELDSKRDDVIWVYVENINSSFGNNGIGKIKSTNLIDLINS
ncbi:MAG: hypothetical protein JKY54_05630 [Flavobacteriales bacterium]|nr:hypothetical protein [Flavobacteriales bacterium]